MRKLTTTQAKTVPDDGEVVVRCVVKKRKERDGFILPSNLLRKLTMLQAEEEST